MEDKRHVRELFDSMKYETEDEPLPAAILTLSVVIGEAVERIGREIAMGIRAGLFGADASSSASVDIAASRVGDGLEALANTIDDADLRLSNPDGG